MDCILLSLSPLSSCFLSSPRLSFPCVWTSALFFFVSPQASTTDIITETLGMFWSCFDRLPASLSARNTHRHAPSHATYRMLPMYMMHSVGATWNLRDRYRALFMSSCRICIGFLWGGGRCRNSCVKLRKKLKDSQTAFARLIVSPFLFVAFGAHCWSLCRKLWRALCNNL